MENSQCHFRVSKHVMPLNIKVQKILDKYIIGIFVARKGGDILYSKQFNKNKRLNLDLMGNFIAALSLFGEENTGKIKRILIEGLNIEMSIVVKHELILTMLFKPNMVKDYLPEFYERGLDQFYNRFKKTLKITKQIKKFTNRLMIKCAKFFMII